jgi:hypothetical protein
MIQESPSKFFLTVSGILKPRHAAHRSRTPTAGVLMQPTVRKHGKSSTNGSGISVWNSAIICTLIRCARPSLLRHTPRCTIRLALRHRPHKGLGKLPWPCPGKRAASRGKILSSNRMARFTVQQVRSFVPMSGAERPMGACAWCMRPASGVAALVLCANSANGKGTPLRSRAR